jgi:hypothetical protein
MRLGFRKRKEKAFTMNIETTFAWDHGEAMRGNSEA